MFSSITDPVKKAEAELDALLAEISPADQAPQSSEDTDISTAPVGNGTLDRQQSQPANTSAATDAELLAMSADAELKARYASLQGKYSAEVPRLASELAHVKRQLAELQSMPAATQMADGDTYRSPYVTDEMRSSRSYQKMAKEFGDDYAENNFEASALTAKQAARSEMQPFQDQVAQSATDRLHAEISR